MTAAHRARSLPRTLMMKSPRQNKNYTAKFTSIRTYYPADTLHFTTLLAALHHGTVLDDHAAALRSTTACGR